MANKMVIIDGDAVARKHVRRSAAGPLDTVLEFASPEEAFKVLDVFQPDCVVLGIHCPPPDAFQAIRAIRKKQPEVRVVAVNHFNEQKIQQAANAAGADSYVTAENLSELFLLAAPERLTLKPVRRLKPRRQTKVVLQPR